MTKLSEQTVPEVQSIETRLVSFFDGLRTVVPTASETRTKFERRLDSFFSGLRPVADLVRKAQETVDRYVATEFSVFEYFRQDENTLSDIFSDLLDPNGSHGQGDCFLVLFLRRIGWRGLGRAFGTDGCRIHREYITDKYRRIDIVIEFPGRPRSLIGIENKPWAGESENQIFDYTEQLTKSVQDKWMMVYMSGDGSLPISISRDRREKYEADGKFLTMAFRKTENDSDTSLEGWLQECRSVCEAERMALSICVAHSMPRNQNLTGWEPNNEP